MDLSFIRAVAHAGTVKKGQFNFTGSQLVRKVRAGNFRPIDTGALKSRLAKIDAAEIRLAKVTVAKVQSIGSQPPQVEPSQIAAPQVDRFS